MNSTYTLRGLDAGNVSAVCDFLPTLCKLIMPNIKDKHATPKEKNSRK